MSKHHLFFAMAQDRDNIADVLHHTVISSLTSIPRVRFEIYPGEITSILTNVVLFLPVNAWKIERRYNFRLP